MALNDWQVGGARSLNLLEQCEQFGKDLSHPCSMHTSLIIPSVMLKVWKNVAVLNLLNAVLLVNVGGMTCSVIDIIDNCILDDELVSAMLIVMRRDFACHNYPHWGD